MPEQIILDGPWTLANRAHNPSAIAQEPISRVTLLPGWRGTGAAARHHCLGLERARGHNGSDALVTSPALPHRKLARRVRSLGTGRRAHAARGLLTCLRSYRWCSRRESARPPLPHPDQALSDHIRGEHARQKDHEQREHDAHAGNVHAEPAFGAESRGSNKSV